MNTTLPPLQIGQSATPKKSNVDALTYRQQYSMTQRARQQPRPLPPSMIEIEPSLPPPRDPDNLIGIGRVNSAAEYAFGSMQDQLMPMMHGTSQNWPNSCLRWKRGQLADPPVWFSAPPPYGCAGTTRMGASPNVWRIGPNYTHPSMGNPRQLRWGS